MEVYLETLSAIVRDPTSNLTAAVLFLAAALLVMLIAVVLVLVFIAPSRDDRSANTPALDRSPAAIRQPKKRRASARVLDRLSADWDSLPPTIRLLAVALLIVATLVGTYVETGTDRFCAESCHQMTASSETWHESAHATVGCVRCHEGRPVTSGLVALVTRSGYVGGSLTGGQPDEVTIPPDRCLQCHRTVLSGSIETTDGIRMNHAAPVDAGASCADCHFSTGHQVEQPTRPSRMQVCLRCHDDLTASSACEICHVGDIGSQPVYSRVYRKTALPQPTCGGCHDESTCDACHGLRMPHSQKFIQGEHARQSGFDLKVLCWRCHPQGDCMQCHGNWDSHGPDFKRTHQSKPRDSACFGCHDSHTGPFCDRCH